MGFFTPGLQEPMQPRPAVDWDEPRCLLCSSQRGTILIEASDPLPTTAPSARRGQAEDNAGLWFAVTQCQDCGLCYTSPRPSAEAMSQFYPSHYPPHQKAIKRVTHRRLHWPLARHGNLEKLPLQGQGRLLDFGCGNGAFLLRMHQRGWHVTGIDASEHAVHRVRNNLGFSALVGSLPHAELGGRSFDVITMRHSLEHVHQPLEVLRAANHLLEPGGLLIVSAPNIDSLPFKWFGRHWRGLDLPRHLTHFTPDTLQLMLSRAGFDVGAVRMIRHPEWVRRSADLASQEANSPRWHRWLRSRFMARLATWYGYFARRSDAMMVTAVKIIPAPRHSEMDRQSVLASGHPPFGRDRWRDDDAG